MTTHVLALSWSPPQTHDPAAPPIRAYRVYRDTGSGFGLLAEALGTTYVDGTVAAASYKVTAATDGGAESLPAGPVHGEIPAILDNHLLHATFTNYGTSGRPLSVRNLRAGRHRVVGGFHGDAGVQLGGQPALRCGGAALRITCWLIPASLR